MKAPCSPFAKFRSFTHTVNGICESWKSPDGPTFGIERQFMKQTNFRRKRCCVSLCSMERHGTNAVTTEEIKRDQKLLHAATLVVNTDNSNEAIIEKVIYNCRFMAFLGVIGSLMGSVICFLKGCVYVFNSFKEYFVGGKVVMITLLLEAIDVFLFGTVMLVFGMGLYELFISNLDIAKASSYGSNLLGLFRLPERPKWLEIETLNELKTKVGHVIVMLLLIGLFENSKKVAIHTPTDLLCFAASILLSSGCLFLLSKLQQ